MRLASQTAAWVVCAVLSIACSNNNQPPPAPCHGCLGCCNENGLCESGMQPAACGSGGAACVACPDGVRCVVGVCELPGDGGPFACGTTTCDGTRADLCSNGTCFCGAEPACGPGAHCASGKCECGAEECPNGCCSGGRCVDSGPNACGLRGAACVDCMAAGGDTCDAGVCSCAGGPTCPPGDTCFGACECDPNSCPGCCDVTNNLCVLPAEETLDLCGAPGQFCEPCSSGFVDHCGAALGCMCGDGGQCFASQTCTQGRCL
jgi:hypothetical protein